MARQISAIMYDFQPDFPDAIVHRYPSLTRALGNNYPGLRSATVEDAERRWASSRNESILPSEPSMPVACLPDSIHPWIPADEISSERMSKISSDTSIFGNKSFPRWQDPYLSPYEPLEVPPSAPSFDCDCFIPISEGPTITSFDTSNYLRSLTVESSNSCILSNCMKAECGGCAEGRCQGQHKPQFSAVVSNFQPEFPDATGRYTSLTRALNNDYPRLRSAADEGYRWNASIWPLQPSVPTTYSSESVYSRITTADETSSERTSKTSDNNSILGNNSLPR
ncbi:hypothetical protein B0H19DRAFT_1226427 [Mycena capillaripes]|nr:hypothetical protein B0H19DRAFT_1226427 [Mycena capillaripes]